MSLENPLSRHDVYMALATLELYLAITADPKSPPLDEECRQSATEALALVRSIVERAVSPAAQASAPRFV